MAALGALRGGVRRPLLGGLLQVSRVDSGAGPGWGSPLAGEAVHCCHTWLRQQGVGRARREPGLQRAESLQAQEMLFKAYLVAYGPNSDFHFFFFFSFLRQGFSPPCISPDAPEHILSLCRPGCPRTHSCLSLPSASIKSVCRHHPANHWFNQVLVTTQRYYTAAR